MKSRKIMALLCCTVLAAGLTGCSGSGTSSQVTSAAGQEPAGTSGDAGQKSEGAAASSDAAAPEDKTFNIDLATAYASDGPAGVALEQFVAAPSTSAFLQTGPWEALLTTIPPWPAVTWIWP